MPSAGTVFPAFLRLQHQDDGSARSAFLREVDQTLNSAEDRFKSFSGEARKQLDAALSAPRTAGGSLDLGAGPARAAAEAAQARAIAAREIANATSIAAKAEGDYSQQARLAVAAANALAIEEAQAARAALDHAKALEQVQAVLSRQASATDAVVVGGKRLVAANDAGAVSAGQHRAGVQQLGFQLSDLGVQLGLAAQSANPMKLALIGLSQQAPQVIQAMAMMRGEAGGLLGFLSGPWGMGLLAAGTVLGSLALAHNSAADSSKAHQSAAEDLRKALDELRDATVREGQSTFASIQADIDKANSLRQRAQEARKAAVAELQLAQAKARDAGASISAGAPGYSNTFNLGRQAGQESNARDAQAKISALNADIAAANETIRLKRGALVRKQVTESLDASAAATGRYERTIDRLNAQLQAGTIGEDAYRAAVTAATKARDAATTSGKRSTSGHGANTAATREATSAAKEYAKALAAVAAAYDRLNQGNAWGSSALAGRIDAMARATDPAAKIGAPANDNGPTIFEQIAQANAEALKPLASLSTGLQTWGERMDAARAAGAGSVMAMAPEAFFANLARAMGPLADQIGEIFGPAFVGKLGGVLEGAVRGEASGGTPGGIIGALKGIEGLPEGLSAALGKAGAGAATGSIVSGLSNVLGIKMSQTGAQIGGAIGSFIPIPGGQIIGSIAGGLLGNLFKSVKSGYAQVRGGVVAGTYGKTGDLQTQAAASANALIDQFKGIADKLGASLGQFSFDIGSKDNKFAFTPGAGAGAGITQWFDKEADALSAALRSVIASGAFEGVSDGVKRLLSSGDVQTQLQKALDFQGVFKRLKGYTDPVGAALDDMNKQFADLKTTFAEAGASAAEYAQLEQLYGLERAKAIKAAMQQVSGDLQGLLDDLAVGNSARSLREREGLAKAALDPLSARVAAGDSTAFADFASASRALIDISRQIYGSQDAFFAVQDSITAQTQAALARQTAIANAATSRDSPFGATTVISDNAATVAAIDAQTSTLAAGQQAMNENLATLISLARSGGASVLPSAVGYW